METVRAYLSSQLICGVCFSTHRVRDDVFRAPQKPMLLSILIGNGVQIVIMLLFVLSEIYFSSIR